MALDLLGLPYLSDIWVATESKSLEFRKKGWTGDGILGVISHRWHLRPPAMGRLPREGGWSPAGPPCRGWYLRGTSREDGEAWEF